MNLRRELLRVAGANAVSFVRLENTYNHCTKVVTADGNLAVDFEREFEDEEEQLSFIESALNETIGIQDGLNAKRCAYLFLTDEEGAQDQIKALINNTPGGRRQEMRELIFTQVRLECLNAQLPEIFMVFGEDGTMDHPTMSCEDRQLFHQLFRQRIKPLQKLDRQNNGVEPHQKRMNSKRFEHTREIWYRENFDYDFPSIKDPEERGSYDRGRDKSMDQPLHIDDLLDPL